MLVGSIEAFTLYVLSKFSERTHADTYQVRVWSIFMDTVLAVKGMDCLAQHICKK